MNRDARFWNRAAAGYARKPIADEAAWRHKLDIMRAHLRPDMDVLEFGCGTGGTARALAPAVARYTAIDFSQAMIDIAGQRNRDAGMGDIRLECAGIEDWPAPPQGLDAVIGMSILHLVRDPGAVTARVHDLLKPGGYFFSSTFCLGAMNPLARAALPVLGRLRIIPRINRFDGAGLCALMTGAGLTVEALWTPPGSLAAFVVARRPA